MSVLNQHSPSIWCNRKGSAKIITQAILILMFLVYLHIILLLTDPFKWKKARVAKWVDDVCDEYEIDQEDVKELKLLNGAGLSCLPKEDWIRRSRQGDFMFMKWNELVQKRSGLKEQTRHSTLDMDTLHAKSKGN